jgi:hypothetical protein
MRTVKRKAIKEKLVLKPVESSNILAIGYKGKDMYVQYNNKVIYIFKDLPKTTYLEIINSSSIGKALHATGIKGIPYVE